MIFCTETPQQILDDENIDIFEDEIVPAGLTIAKQDIIDEFWHQYRYRGLSLFCPTGIPGDDPTRDMWIQMAQDRFATLWQTWQYAIADWVAAVTDGSISETADDVTTSHSSGDTEDLPDTPLAAGDEYLSNRYKNDVRVERKIGQAHSKITDLSKMQSPIVEFVKRFNDLFLIFN